MKCEDSYGRVGERVADPGVVRNSTERPTELTNLVPWGSQRLNHQPNSIPGLDLAPNLHTSVADIQLDLPMGPQVTGVEAIPKLLLVCGRCSYNWAALSVLSGRGCT